MRCSTVGLLSTPDGAPEGGTGVGSEMKRPFRRLSSWPERSRIGGVARGGHRAGLEVGVSGVGRFNPVELALFVRALPLAWRAQRVRTLPVHAVVEDLCRWSAGLHEVSIERLARAADRAGARWNSWFGGMNTCLIRALVLGALLADRGEVVLNLGFRRGDDPEPRLAGHAWVTVGGRPVGSDGHLAGSGYTRVLEIPYRATARRAS